VPESRELEFLPAWYPALRRRRRSLWLQVGATSLLVLCAAAWLTCARHRIRVEETRLSELTQQRQRRKQESLLIEKLGRHVEAPRILAALDRAMPAGVTLTETSLEVESAAAPTALAWVNFAPWWQVGGPAVKDDDAARRIRVRLRGVAPTAVDAANFVAALSTVPFFRQVAMTDAKDTGDAAAANEFQMTFAMDLVSPSAGGGGGAAAAVSGVRPAGDTAAASAE
jgi:hypothetical protein